MTTDQKIGDLRKALAKESIVPPPAWFEHTIKSGVCWLNTSLTFTSTDIDVLKQHVTFWSPIVEGIVASLIDAKRQLKASGNPKAGLVFVLWGGYAQKLRKMVERLNNSGGTPIDLVFVEAAHPAATGDSFHTTKTFEAVDQALVKLGLSAIDWLPKGASSTVVIEAKKKAPAKKATAATATASSAPTAAGESKEVESVEIDVKVTTVKAKATGKKATAAKKASSAAKADIDDEEAEKDAPKTSRPKRAVAKRASKMEVDSDLDDSVDSEEEEKATKKRKTPAKRSAKKSAASAESDDEFEDTDAKPKVKRAKRS